MSVLPVPRAALFLLAGGCLLRRPPITELPGEPCDRALMQIQFAPYGDDARGRVRDYLTCSELNEPQPRLDLREQVTDRLRLNEYPATRREADEVVGWFFDRERLKALPKSDQELTAYLRLLDDQALSARAMGDLKLAAAIDARGKKLQTLERILGTLGSD